MSRTWEENATEFGALSKQGKDLRLALLAACSVQEVGQGKGATAPFTTATGFAQKAGTHKDRVLRHLRAWDQFAKQAGYPIAADLTPNDAIGLEINEEDAAIWDTIILSEHNRGTRGKPTPDQLKEQIKNDPTTRQAALDAVVESGDVAALSSATAKAARNRQVERNRERVSKGDTRGTSKPLPKEPVHHDKVLMFRGISDALVALNTTFKNEWESLTASEQADSENLEFFNEGLDQVQISVEGCRILIGGVSEEDLQSLLDGAS